MRFIYESCASTVALGNSWTEIVCESQHNATRIAKISIRLYDMIGLLKVLSYTSISNLSFEEMESGI